jgi:hypothetical protein
MPFAEPRESKKLTFEKTKKKKNSSKQTTLTLDLFLKEYLASI